MRAKFWGMRVLVCLALSPFAHASHPHVPGQLIVKLDSTKIERSKAVALIRDTLSKTVAVQSISTFLSDSSLHRVTLVKARALRVAMDRLNKTPGIRYAEPNYIYTAAGYEMASPNDQRLSELWNLHNSGQRDKEGQVGRRGADIQVLPLWNDGIRGDRRILVAVLDTGIDWRHPDLQANLFTNTAEIPGNGVDDDRNGYVDDVHGWNFLNGTPRSFDDHGHGTHCAGTIGAVGDNGVGVVGVNWRVSLLPLKILGQDGHGSLDAAIEAIHYAIRMRVNVMSNSWGGVAMSYALQEAIERARDAGILFVVASGNSRVDCNADQTPIFPASYKVENIVSVAASDNRDQLAGFSCYGKRTVHVAAPGNWILSTYKGGTYEVMRGSSMAAPHVAGLAALLLSGRPEWTYKELKERIVASTDKLDGMKRKIQGSGRINAYNAWMGIYPPSDEPDEDAWRDQRLHLETRHPYAENSDLTFPIEVPGAKFIRVIFDRVDLEWGYDRLWLEDAATGQKITEVEGRGSSLITDYVEGSRARIRFTSDASVNNWGFKVSRIQVIY